MHYTLTQTVAPVSEPVTVEEAKAQARIDADLTDEDGLLRAYIRAATRQIESETGRQLMLATYVMRLNTFPETWGRYASACFDWIELPRPPLIAVSSVQYVDSEGVTQTWATSNYTVDTYADPGRVYLAYDASWPTIRSIPNAGIITYLAGYGAELDDDLVTYNTVPEKVPEELRVAILLWVAELYKNREPTGDRIAHMMPYSVERLIWPYRLASVLVG
jgi:uncharacterized phiE125 gp8 family phage protein